MDLPPWKPRNVDLKKTVNLPKTDFPMKANLPQNEPKLLERWQKGNIYRADSERARGRPKYVLHDGPPYANGNIHLGHAFNKMLKDFIVKSKTMAGFDSPYVPGWDCHGLPIEIKVDSELGSKKAQMSAAEIRRACRKYAQKYVDLQSEDFIRLGIFGRLGRSLPHHGAAVQSVIAGAFVDFLDQGYIYKGLKPVNWCINDRTALAEAEVEYENHTSPSIWVRFALASDPATIDPGARRPQSLRPDLDHHALDDPGEHGHRLSPEVRIRRLWTWAATCTSLPRDLLKATAENVRLARPASPGDASPAQASRTPSSAIRFWTAIRLESWPTTSPWSKAPERCTPRPGTARRTMSSGGSTASTRTARWTRRGRFFHAEGATAGCRKS